MKSSVSVKERRSFEEVPAGHGTSCPTLAQDEECIMPYVAGRTELQALSVREDYLHAIGDLVAPKPGMSFAMPLLAAELG